MLELWHATHSTCSQKVHLCLAEKRLPWESRLVDLRRGPWLAGEDYSLADVDMAPFVHRIASLGEGALIEARPGVADWYRRMRARKAFVAAITASGSAGSC